MEEVRRILRLHVGLTTDAGPLEVTPMESDRPGSRKRRPAPRRR